MKIALAVEYDGSGFCGWQRQPHCHSVQAELEQALARVADAPITVHCAGRTDTGVHALAQVVHFETEQERVLRAWVFGANSHLQNTVAVHWAAPVTDEFHARFSALNRSYRYSILNRAARPALDYGRQAWIKNSLDAARMHDAAQLLLGERDFSSFRAAECQAQHARRELQRIEVWREDDRVHVEVQANGFLHNMVRIITGCLIRIGEGERDRDWLAEVLESRDRTRAAYTAPAAGLCFLQPRYPDHFGIPDFSRPALERAQRF